MAKFLFSYSGGATPTTPEEGARSMAIWVGWFQGLGSAVVDMGNPTGPTKTVASNGAVAEDPNGPTGYSIISADSLDAAVVIAKGCPVLQAGGGIGVSEIQDMM